MKTEVNQQKQPAMSLEEVYTKWINQDSVYMHEDDVKDVMQEYANQFREAQKWVGRVEKRIDEIETAIGVYDEKDPIRRSIIAERTFLFSLLQTDAPQPLK